MPNNVIELVIKVNDQASAKINGVTTRVDRMSRALAGVGVVAAGFGVAVAIGLRKVALATINAQEAAAQLDAAFKATGGTVGITRQKLDELAVSIQRTTVFDDDLVRSAESVLLTFDKVRGEAFERTIRVATDLSARMGTDLVTAVRSVGVALQEPEEGLNRLRRAGVIFNESQREIIKNLVEAGKATEAQNFILSELERRFNGAAESARNTLGGALKGLKNAFSDLLEFNNTQTAGLVSVINTLTENLGKLTAALLIGVSAWTLYRGAILSVGIAAAVAEFVKLFAAIATGRAVLISATAQNAALTLSNQAAAVAALEAANAEVVRTQAMLAGTRATQARVLANTELIASEATRATVARNVAGAEAASATALAAQAAAAAKVANGAKAATAATGALAVATSKLRGALALLGLTNPYVLLAAGIGAVIALIVKGQTDVEFAAKARQHAINAEIAQIKGFAGIQSDYQKKRLIELEAEKLRVDALTEAYARQREQQALGITRGEPQRGRGQLNRATTPLDPDVRKRLEEAASAVDKAKKNLVELRLIFDNVKSRFAAGSEEMELATHALTQAQKEYNEALREASERPEIEPIVVTARWDNTLKEWNEDTKTALEKNIDEWRAFNAKLKVLVSEGLDKAVATARVREKLDELIPEVEVTVTKIDTRPFQELTAAGKRAAEQIQDAFATAFRGIFEGDSFRNIARNFLRAFAEIPVQIMAEDFSRRVRKAMDPTLAKMFGTVGGAAGGATAGAGPTAQERAAGIVEAIKRDAARTPTVISEVKAATGITEPIVQAVQTSQQSLCECVCSCLTALRESLVGGPDAVVAAIDGATDTDRTTARAASKDVVAGIDASLKESTQAINNTTIGVGNQITSALASLGGGGAGGLLDAVKTGFQLFTMGGFAGGGRTPAGIFDVGEEGRERVLLPAGSRVMNQRQMAFAGQEGAQVNLYETHHITIEGASDADDTQKRLGAYLVMRDAKLEQRIFDRLKANGFGRMR